VHEKEEESLEEGPREAEEERGRNRADRQLRGGDYLPFSLGPKACIASKFATAEMILLVSSLVYGYALRLMPKEGGGKKDIDEAVMLVPRKH